MNYVYVVTNLINGKIYVGKRCHLTPHQDSYMGSGKLIKEAIRKYGKENFVKQILAIFGNDADAAAYEAEIVTKFFASSHGTYNMHEGGAGGFSHINDGSIAHRERARLASTKSSSKFHPNWGKYKFQKGSKDTRELSRIANLAKAQDMKDNPEKYEKIRSLISEYQKTNNSMKGKCWCVPENSTDYDLDKKVFPINNIPDGWISLNQIRDDKKSKTGTYGKYWIHNPDTLENKYWSGEIPDGWFKGRKMEYYQRTVG